MRKVSPAVGLVAVLSIAAMSIPASAATFGEFGRCLTEKGAVFYGTSWCPVCEAQKQTLGEALPGVRYVECSIGGERGRTAGQCTAAGVTAYPTWVFGDGSRASGAMSLSALARKTGCENPSTGGRYMGERPAVQKTPKGPKIIEVPQE